MKILLGVAIAVILISCGYGDGGGDEYVPYDPETPDQVDPEPEPEPGGTSYLATQTILNRRCQSCHANAAFMQGERQLRASSVYDRVYNESMPPGGGMPANERADVLNFF